MSTREENMNPEAKNLDRHDVVEHLLPGTAPERPDAPLSQDYKRQRIGVLLFLVALFGGGFLVYTITQEPPASRTVIGNLTILPDAEPISPGYATYKQGSVGCQGAGGYDDLNSSTSVVIKNHKGEEVDRTSLGKGFFMKDGCAFFFMFEVTEGPRYFVLSVGNRGEMQYTYNELATPWRVSLYING